MTAAIIGDGVTVLVLRHAGAGVAEGDRIGGDAAGPYGRPARRAFSVAADDDPGMCVRRDFTRASRSGARAVMAVGVPEASRAFGEHRDRLFAIAYRMLGRVGDAEDVVQDAWLRWSDVDTSEVADPEAYLVRVVTRLAIDRLRSAQARREEYVGPWLPEPVVTTPDIAEKVALADTVSTAMLVLLESLSPLERAVFVLREAFGYPYAEIAEMVGRSEASVRQTARRAREHIEQRRVRYDTDRTRWAEVTQRFLAAAGGGDLAGLMAVLAPEVTLISDGGGKAPAPRKAIVGVDLVARALLTFAGRMPADPRTEIVELNGGPGIVLYSGTTPVAAVTLYLVGGAVHTIYLVSNPDKLTRL